MDTEWWTTRLAILRMAQETQLRTGMPGMMTPIEERAVAARVALTVWEQLERALGEG